MAIQRRKFTDDEKKEMLRQANLQGVTNMLRQYNLSYSVYSKWKEKFNKNSTNTDNPQLSEEIILLLDENKRLKKIVANQALSIEKKTEELKNLMDQQRHK